MTRRKRRWAPRHVFFFLSLWVADCVSISSPFHTLWLLLTPKQTTCEVRKLHEIKKKKKSDVTALRFTWELQTCEKWVLSFLLHGDIFTSWPVFVYIFRPKGFFVFFCVAERIMHSFHFQHSNISNLYPKYEALIQLI